MVLDRKSVQLLRLSGRLNKYGQSACFGRQIALSNLLRKIWKSLFKNENSPRLTVPAKIVDMRTQTHHHHSNGHHHHSHTYHVTFEVESGDRMELKVSRNEYGMLVVGDSGRVSFQGTRYLGFERGLEEPDETVI